MPFEPPEYRDGDITLDFCMTLMPACNFGNKMIMSQYVLKNQKDSPTSMT